MKLHSGSQLRIDCPHRSKLRSYKIRRNAAPTPHEFRWEVLRLWFHKGPRFSEHRHNWAPEVRGDIRTMGPRKVYELTIDERILLSVEFRDRLEVLVVIESRLQKSIPD